MLRSASPPVMFPRPSAAKLPAIAHGFKLLVPVKPWRTKAYLPLNRGSLPLGFVVPVQPVETAKTTVGSAPFAAAEPPPVAPTVLVTAAAALSPTFTVATIGG